jgi:hypothetical protein
MLTAQLIPRKVAVKARAALAPYVTRPGRQMAEVASLGRPNLTLGSVLLRWGKISVNNW